MQTVRIGLGLVSMLCAGAAMADGRAVIASAPADLENFFERFDPGVDSSTLPIYGLRLDRGVGQGVFDTGALLIDAPVLAQRDRVCVSVHSIDGWFEAVNVYRRDVDAPPSERWRVGSLAYEHAARMGGLGTDRIFGVVNVVEDVDDADPCNVQRALHVPVVDVDDPEWTHLTIAVNTSGRNIRASIAGEDDEMVADGRCAPTDGIDAEGALIDTLCRFPLPDDAAGAVTLNVSFGAGAFSDTPDPVRIALPARR